MNDAPAPAAPRSPGRDCPSCPRLAGYRRTNRGAWPDWHNAPVPPFGPLSARLLIVGLAPGLRGANRTGRPFTGDDAGDLLFAVLAEFGFAEGVYARRADDGLTPVDCRITNGVRCAPPQNRPTGAEVAACRAYLAAEMRAMPRLRVVLALGRVAHATTLAAVGLTAARHPFAHGARHALPGDRRLIDSYHCSRYNTNTGRLTAAMFRDVFRAVERELPR